MVEAARQGSQAAQAVKTAAAFAGVERFTQGAGFEEIYVLEVGRASGTRRAATRTILRVHCGNLIGQADLDRMSRAAAFDEAQNASGYEAPHRSANRGRRKAGAASERPNGKAKLPPPL